MTRNEILTKSKLILFNTDMVRAIQDGRKTVTRRAIKNIHEYAHMLIDIETEERNAVFICGKVENGTCYDWEEKIKMPFMESNYLYVRETWTELETVYGVPYYAYKVDDHILHHSAGENFKKWKPSIHMPKKAARIFLRVTDIRVERLQDITEEQAINEGCNGEFFGTGEMLGSGWKVTPQDEFSEIWDSTIKKSDLDKYGWEANPWVWVITFERVEVE